MRRDDWLLQQLPVGMSEQDFLRRYLMIIQSVSDTVLQQIDVLDRIVDPTVAPGPMVREMGRWIGVDWIDSSWPIERQRRIVLGYAEALRWRGTARGLRMLFELAVEGAGTVRVTDSGGVFPEGESPRRPPHVSIEMPASEWAHPDDLVQLARAELPANVTFDLVIDGTRVWPPADRGAGGERRHEEVR
jgi:phage tail-like protein